MAEEKTTKKRENTVLNPCWSSLTDLLSNSLNLKSDEVIIEGMQNIISQHSLGEVQSWRDQSKHRHAVTHVLVNFNKQEAIKALVPELDQINLPRESDKCTPLHLSIWKKNLKLSKILIDFGANPLLQNKYGEDCQELQEQVSKSNNICFIDLELTNVPSDPESSILEIGIVVTNQCLEEISRNNWVVKKTKEDMESLSEWHQRSFKSIEQGGNGLFDAIASELSLPLDVIKSEVMTFVKEYFPPKACSFAGFSVHGDREVLKREVPDLYEYMSHQIIDVSTLLNVSSKWKPDVLIGKPEQQGSGHRAMSDVLHSIETMKFLKDQLFAE